MYKLLGKRVLDLALATTLLIISMPILIITAILIILIMGRPINFLPDPAR